MTVTAAQIDKIGTAMGALAKAQQDTATALNGIAERQAQTEAKITELQDIAGKHDKLAASLGTLGGDPDESEILRYDPNYRNAETRRLMPNALAARAMAHFMRFVIAKHQRSADWLKDHGIEMRRVEEVDSTRAGSIHDDELGGYALPPEFGGVIIPALGRYGIAAREAMLEQMGSPKKTFAKDAADIDIYPLEEHAEIEEVQPAYQQLTLEAKLWGAFLRWSADFDEYGLVNEGEAWTDKFARAIAKKQDQCLFIGDGSSTYNNNVGVLNNADVASLSLAATKTDFTDVGYDDIVNLIANTSDDVYEEGNCKFFLSNSMVWLLALLKDGIGRPLWANPTEGVSQTILGEPVVRSAVMPRLSASAAGTKFLAFGDMRRAYKLGVRTQMAVAFSPHTYFRNAQNCLRVLSRFGVKAAFTDAITVLKTADA